MLYYLEIWVESTKDTSMQETYDVVVIGAGPAGLSAVHHLYAKDSPRVLLVDKSTPWMRPKGCAEAVGRIGFEKAVEVRPSWIRFLVDKASFHPPSGPSITYTDKNKGYIINRALMQKDMADQCKQLGADVVVDCAVTGVSTVMGGRRNVYFQNGSSISASVVVDASGPIAGLGKFDKIPRKPLDLEPSCFAVVNIPDFPSNVVHIYIGQKIAPGGYAWVFPREKDVANIGIVIGKSFRGKVNMLGLLDAFLKLHFRDGKVLDRFAGSIPCQSGRRKMAAAGLLKTGDAASSINPISRAGIVQAMISGGLAGDFALKMLGAQTLADSNSHARDYEKAWHAALGKTHCKLARVKDFMQNVPDSDFEKAAQALSEIPENKLTMSSIFKMSLGRFPRLVWAMRHLM